MRTIGLVAAAVFSCACTQVERSYAAEDRNPVLFVHGSGLGPDSWDAMLEGFLDVGYPPQYLAAVRLTPDDGDNIRAAEVFIAPAIERLLETANGWRQSRGLAGVRKVDIVAHSMGAVSSRWYTAKIAPQRVGVWVGIAGANHGTNVLCGREGMGDRQLCPAFGAEVGSLQLALNGTDQQRIDETPFGVGLDLQAESVAPDQERRVVYHTIRLPRDRWIVPADSARLDGTGDGSSVVMDHPNIEVENPGAFILTTPVTHDDLPADPDVISLVLKLLANS